MARTASPIATRSSRLATDSIAGNLAAHGVVKGDRVSVFSTNPLAATLLMFGIWKAGAVYALVNFSFAGRLLAYQLDDTAPRLLVTDPGLLPAVNAVADQLTHLPTLVLYTPPAGAHDHVGDPQPVGRPGQLAVRPKLPALIMSQYLGKPEATVTAWRNLWFHTGDAAVLQPDGMFDFVDRLGDRIRVRGENLSSFQVDDLLNQHERIQLTAAFAEDTMPKYMRPRHIRVVPDVPRTPTNKIEKYKLRSRLLDERADGWAGS
jgi:acyl-CoA synthetase (AMP-forming)/AMP-acid ligase II